MDEKELKDLIAKLDNRYITKEEFESEVFRYTSSRFASKGELLKAIGRVEAIIVEQSRNNELVEHIYKITTKNLEQSARNVDALEQLNIELSKAKEHVGKRIWNSLPYLLRAVIMFAGMWLLLIISTTIIGHQADNFMKTNGLYVFFGNAILSLVTSKNWGEK